MQPGEPLRVHMDVLAALDLRPLPPRLPEAGGVALSHEGLPADVAAKYLRVLLARSGAAISPPVRLVVADRLGPDDLLLVPGVDHRRDLDLPLEVRPTWVLGRVRARDEWGRRGG